jgi:hypothetical protein
MLEAGKESRAVQSDTSAAPTTGKSPKEAWPSLPYKEWQDTYETLHMWTQIVAKIRLALSPRVNHWWQVTLYVTPSGLTTSPIPYPVPYADGTFEILFDFIDHKWVAYQI